MGLGAALASFILPGLGQGIKGEIAKAFKIFGISLLLGILQSLVMAATSGSAGSPNIALMLVISIPGVMFFFAQVLDAYGSYDLPL